MYKQSPSRSHRSKGFKVKHILQLCLLLAVCFWLIYQVKHSHQKNKEFDSKDAKLVGKVHTDDIRRFGRKDLPRATEIATDVEKHGGDEEEKEMEEEENKHEEDEPEKEDDKHEEGDGEGRGGGDDEIDENDSERADVEPDHEEESVDEDKEREENEGASEENHHENEENEDVGKDHSVNEENENVGKEDPTEPEHIENVGGEDHNEGNVASEDQDHDGVDPDTHEAREEQYKADDASSEVTHDIKTIIPETGNLTTGHASEIYDKVNFGRENETQTSYKDGLILHSVVHPREDMNSSVTSNATVTEQKKYRVDLNKSEDNPLQNSTFTSLHDDQPENRSNSTDVSGEHTLSLLSNGTQAELPSSLPQNATGEGGIREEGHLSKPELAEVRPNRTENVYNNDRESLNQGNTTWDPSHNAMATVEDGSLRLEENTGNSGTSGSDGSSESRSSDDTSNTDLPREERESRTDLGTLPEIRSEVQNTNNTVAE